MTAQTKPRVDPNYKSLAYKDWIAARKNVNHCAKSRGWKHTTPQEWRTAMSVLKAAARRWKLVKDL